MNFFFDFGDAKAQTILLENVYVNVKMSHHAAINYFC